VPPRYALAAALCLAAGPARSDTGDYLRKPDAWFAGDEAGRVGANILSFQAEAGGWPKNVDTSAGPYNGDRAALRPTFDNGATTDELRFLARLFDATGDPAHRAAFLRGLDYVLRAQYPNGGWPQYHPPGKGYHRHITFNDNAMVRLMLFVRDVATADGFAFVDDARRGRAGAAFDRGVGCILKCQIKVNGRPAAWCAQHDEIDLRPRPARSFELATLSGAESVGLTRLLMSLDDPSPEVVRAVEGAVAWFEKVKLSGIRVTIVKDRNAIKGTNKLVVPDPAAPPLWARFYAIGTDEPVFADRDGVPKPALADIGDERRNGYAWYGSWPRTLLEAEYPAWKRRVAAGTTVSRGPTSP